MARIDVLPSIDIIMGLKGVLDFYLWRGLPCVRAWPQYRPARQTDASKASALLFGAVIKAFSLTHGAMLQQLELEATGIPRTTRDIYVSGVFGNLHEASMSDFLTLLTQCRDFLSALTAILNALDSIDTDQIVVNVDQSVLPAGAATAAAQATQLTALQKIDDLQDALESKALDRLQVRGQDQLISYKGRLLSSKSGGVTGANGYLASHSPAAGEIWLVTTVAAQLVPRATTEHTYTLTDLVSYCLFHRQTQAFAANAVSHWGGHTYMEPGDVIRAAFTGAVHADAAAIRLTGFIMTKET